MIPNEEPIVSIAEATAADLSDVLLVEREAFGGAVEAGLVEELLGDPTAMPRLSLLARVGERPVGHVLFTAVRLRDSARPVSASILAPLAVVPEFQRKGVGGRLTEWGVQRLRDSGVQLVFVLGYPEYYSRHGFEPATPLGLAAPYPISPEEAWMVRALEPGLLGTVRGTVECAETMSRPEYWRE